jgi:DNA-binding transcriptional ArsR family regulator
MILRSKKNSKTSDQSVDGTRRFHERYFRAMNSPLRRTILRALKEGCKTVEDLELKTGMDSDTLKWHLAVLENASCVEKDEEQTNPVYKLTQEGNVVDYLD